MYLQNRDNEEINEIVYKNSNSLIVNIFYSFLKSKQIFIKS